MPRCWFHSESIAAEVSSSPYPFQGMVHAYLPLLTHALTVGAVDIAAIQFVHLVHAINDVHPSPEDVATAYETTVHRFNDSFCLNFTTKFECDLCHSTRPLLNSNIFAATSILQLIEDIRTVGSIGEPFPTLSNPFRPNQS